MPPILTPASIRDLGGGGTVTSVAAGTGIDVDATNPAAPSVAIEPGVYRSGGTDVAVADGGTGASSAAAARTALGLVIGTDVPPVANPTFTGNVVVPDADAATEAMNRQASDARYAPKAQSGFTIVDVDQVRRTAGNLTLNSTAWANVDTGLDLTLAAAIGDVVEYHVNARMGAEAVDVFHDVATIVGGSPVNYFAGAASGDQGVQAWRCLGGTSVVFGAPIRRTLVSGDISGGTVTLRLRYATGSAANRTLVAAANSPLEVGATVYRAVA